MTRLLQEWSLRNGRTLLQVSLDLVDAVGRRGVGVLACVDACAALPEQVPALIESVFE